YACKEDKISKLKGFGQKTQEELKNIVEFSIENEGKYRYVDAKLVSEQIIDILEGKIKQGTLISLTGDLRHYNEIVKAVESVIAIPKNELLDILNQSSLFNEPVEKDDYIECNHQSGINILLHYCKQADFYARLIETTGNEEHTSQLKRKLNSTIPSLESEEAIYKKAGLSYIPLELREGSDELELAENNNLPSLIEYNDLKGSLHNHSLWSDGVFSVEEMALYCRDELHLEYFGISDHSKTAVYANGLSIDRVKAQLLEVEALNKNLSPFRIFKGIESDILSNGS